VLKQLFEFTRHALYLQRDLQQIKEDVAELERGLERTNDALRRLAAEVERINQRETFEREKMFLQLENALLRFERRLPPPRSSK
jgi:hypothetical protein